MLWMFQVHSKQWQYLHSFCSWYTHSSELYWRCFETTCTKMVDFNLLRSYSFCMRLSLASICFIIHVKCFCMSFFDFPLFKSFSEIFIIKYFIFMKLLLLWNNIITYWTFRKGVLLWIVIIIPSEFLKDLKSIFLAITDSTIWILFCYYTYLCTCWFRMFVYKYSQLLFS